MPTVIVYPTKKTLAAMAAIEFLSPIFGADYPAPQPKVGWMAAVTAAWTTPSDAVYSKLSDRYSWHENLHEGRDQAAAIGRGLVKGFWVRKLNFGTFYIRAVKSSSGHCLSCRLRLPCVVRQYFDIVMNLKN